MNIENDERIVIGIQEEPIDVPELIKQMKESEGGALSIFLGTTRDNFQNKKVLKLFYEAHPTMAVKKMKEIASYALTRWNLIKVAIVHRVGEVPVKEESIVIIATSVHRQEAIEATSHCIEEVKRSVPIWKKEIYDNGQGEWKANCECVNNTIK